MSLIIKGCRTKFLAFQFLLAAEFRRVLILVLVHIIFIIQTNESALPARVESCGGCGNVDEQTQPACMRQVTGKCVQQWDEQQPASPDTCGWWDTSCAPR